MTTPATTLNSLRRMVLASLLAALTAVGAWIQVPTHGPLPIVLATVFVLLSGLLLGAAGGALSMVVYVTVGALGLPVFSGGRGGIGHLLGPHGGFLLGYVLAATVCGLLAARWRGALAADILATAAGTAALFAFGLPWLKLGLGLTWEEALLSGLWPFLPGAVIKGVIVVVLARALRPTLRLEHP